MLQHLTRWRLLNDGEIIKSGDEILAYGEWKACDTTTGCKVTEGSAIRRKCDLAEAINNFFDEISYNSWNGKVSSVTAHVGDAYIQCGTIPFNRLRGKLQYKEYKTPVATDVGVVITCEVSADGIHWKLRNLCAIDVRNVGKKYLCTDDVWYPYCRVEVQQ